MGYIPGTPFSIAVHGLLRVSRGGGQGRIERLPSIGEIAIEKSYPEIDVTALEVLVEAMSGDLKTLRGLVIEEAELRRVEEEILLMLELLH